VDGRYLITKRPANTHMGGFWEFPGGKISDGESHSVALKREMLEETNLIVEVGNLFKEIYHEYDDRNIHLFFYNSSILSGDPLPLECDEIKWIPANEFSRYNFPPADTELLKFLTAN